MKPIRSLSLFHSLLCTHNILNTPLSLSLSLCITFALSISLTHFLMRSLSARARCPNRRRKYPQQFQSKILFSKTNFSTFKMIFTNCGRTQFDQKVLIFFSNSENILLPNSFETDWIPGKSGSCRWTRFVSRQISPLNVFLGSKRLPEF